jgi:hypothetical protein
MKNLIETLRNQAVEIAKEGHAGWGNTMSCAADAIEKLDAEGARGKKAIEFVEALIKHRDNGVDLEADGRIYNWIDEYQQSCKEKEDEQTK